ncbi:DUF1826 domain-containing protein [Polyangium jinanense]|uniref:DUF1826 domain-containing protein n=1 Tax=Polyangium jinanense TaxID=2829994 RepID=A0A9X3X7G7_9BACT|nr:DUF1826 domain-containing protein [Polyangium jinanense]MDC3958805.1 DUF1826 domain-containing protein [Polyangium jinanense]MDC3985214.1 DUF1826 domain-containing protein [Polyangium jinanense]
MTNLAVLPLEAAPRTSSAEESGLLRPGALVRRMKPGDVGFLKGKGFPGHERRGAVHRSPPETGAEAPRLLLTLDPLD